MILKNEKTFSPMYKPIIIEPIPEKIPFNKTICKGSLEEILRVQLFSNPPQIVANNINKDP